MTPTWQTDDAGTVDLSQIGVMGWLRFGARAVPIIVLIFVCLIALLALRLIEVPFFGMRRPVTPFIAQFVCRNAFRIMGMKFTTKGAQMTQAGAVVANHSSWLDIFSLNAAARVYFVSKSEVAKWPGIGLLARATGTVFIARDPRQARAQKEVFEDRLKAGHKLLFFPEGTSTDGQRVLPFKSTLFAAFFTPELKEILWVQPVTVNYVHPDGEENRFYGWWGDMDFFPHLIKTLAVRRSGTVEVIYHPPLRVAEAESRKSMALASEKIVRSGHHIAAHEISD
ncbi:lysophospholipid acyltransferase family protein [Planktotalea sp.]|uniref:lysophospholipid acyltransferase family protein n=1 Tax=Planktotalea sp. TaxID=2029877 RepID=UPI0025FCFDCD|nr:lysophospholipid acyltransferase family protein [Planktotalea sp.]